MFWVSRLDGARPGMDAPAARRRVVLLALATALACLGLSASAQSAFATYGKISIKNINVGGPADDHFTFDPSADLAAGGLTLRGGESWPSTGPKTVLANYAGGPHAEKVYRVTEVEKPGYRLASITCRRGTPESSATAIDTDSTTSVAHRQANIRVSQGETVQCTFVKANGGFRY